MKEKKNREYSYNHSLSCTDLLCDSLKGFKSKESLERIADKLYLMIRIITIYDIKL